MGRPAKLDEKDWKEIERRYIVESESARSISKDFSVSESAIRQRFSAQRAEIKSVANQVIEAEQALYSLGVTAQVTAQQLINEMRAISGHIASAAKHNAHTASLFSQMANRQALALASKAEQDIEAVRNTVVMIDASNKSAQIGIELIRLNKEQAQEPDIDATKAFLDSLNGKIIDVSCDDNGYA